MTPSNQIKLQGGYEDTQDRLGSRIHNPRESKIMLSQGFVWEAVCYFWVTAMTGTKKTISPYLNRNGGTWNMGMKKEHDSAHWASFFLKNLRWWKLNLTYNLHYKNHLRSLVKFATTITAFREISWCKELVDDETLPTLNPKPKHQKRVENKEQNGRTQVQEDKWIT